MNKLNYSVSLREKGLSKNEIIQEMKANGFDKTDIEFYLKKSDEIYINQLLNNKSLSKLKKKSNRLFKTAVLIISLLLLVAVFYGYARIGLIGLFVFWSLVKFGSYRRYILKFIQTFQLYELDIFLLIDLFHY